MRAWNSKICFKNVLAEFWPDQRQKLPFNRQIGARYHFTYENEQPQFQDNNINNNNTNALNNFLYVISM